MFVDRQIEDPGQGIRILRAILPRRGDPGARFDEMCVNLTVVIIDLRRIRVRDGLCRERREQQERGGWPWAEP